MNIDLDRLLAPFDPDGRGGRRNMDDVATAIRALAPHIDAAAIPELVRDTVRAGEQQGMWSFTRTATVQRGRTTLPRSITLPRTGAPVDQLRPVGVPLRDELASWAATLPLSRTQRHVLLAVNDWLRRTDGNAPVVETAERAYELMRDEKAFDSAPLCGGATFWAPNRLTFQLLRCHRTPTPLTWEPTTSAVSRPGPVLCVENHATFRTLLRVLRHHTRPACVAVAWVQGRNIAPWNPSPTCRSPSRASITSEISIQPDWPSRQRPARQPHAPEYRWPSRTRVGTTHPAVGPTRPSDRRHRRPPARLLAPRNDSRTSADPANNRPNNPPGSTTLRHPRCHAGLTAPLAPQI